MLLMPRPPPLQLTHDTYPSIIRNLLLMYENTANDEFQPLCGNIRISMRYENISGLLDNSKNSSLILTHP